MTLLIGIDEAGYGPTLGPLAVVAVAAHAENHQAVAACWRAAGIGVVDSKRLHKSGHLAPLERVALALVEWATGFAPATAADLFALLGETPSQRSVAPWCSGAEACRLPLAATDIPTIGAPKAAGLSGRLIHPWQLNDQAAAGANKAAVEWAAIAHLATDWPAEHERDLICDRLGGRRFYGDLLLAAQPDSHLVEQEEVQARSRYTLQRGSHQDRYAFVVGGEAASPLVAAASCVAKYAREIHMHLFNGYWCHRMRWLKPTAGYPQDAKRWLHQIGEGHRSAWGHWLVRGYRDTGH